MPPTTLGGPASVRIRIAVSTRAHGHDLTLNPHQL